MAALAFFGGCGLLADRRWAEEHARAARDELIGGAPERAFDALALATDEAPDAPELWALRAQVLAEGGRLDAAVECARRAVTLRPSAAPLHLLLARCLAVGGRIEEARAAAAAALERQPDDLDALWTEALLAQSAGDRAGALETAARLERAADRAGDPLGSCAARLFEASILPPNAEARARRLVDEALRARPDVVLAALRGLLLSGVGLEGLGSLLPARDDPAVEIARIFAGAEGVPPEQIARRALAGYERLREAKGAGELLRLAARAWLEAGRPREAASACFELLERSPADEEALELLQRLREASPESVSEQALVRAFERAAVADPRLATRLRSLRHRAEGADRAARRP